MEGTDDGHAHFLRLHHRGVAQQERELHMQHVAAAERRADARLVGLGQGRAHGIDQPVEPRNRQLLERGDGAGGLGHAGLALADGQHLDRMPRRLQGRDEPPGRHGGAVIGLQPCVDDHGDAKRQIATSCAGAVAGWGG